MSNRSSPASVQHNDNTEEASSGIQLPVGVVSVDQDDIEQEPENVQHEREDYNILFGDGPDDLDELVEGTIISESEAGYIDEDASNDEIAEDVEQVEDNYISDDDSTCVSEGVLDIDEELDGIISYEDPESHQPLVMAKTEPFIVSFST